MSLLEARNIKKIYTTKFGGAKVTALENISFTVEKGEYTAIMGESGSGKTTLLNLLASIDKPTSGEIFLDGVSLSSIKNGALSSFRRDNLGFVFQDFNLLDTLSIKDNILLPLVLQGYKYNQMEERLIKAVERLNIKEIINKFPYEVSGGQKQRTAVARALITNPKLVLADEPTGALDSKSSASLLKIFEDINKEGQTIVMVTHSTQAASCSGRVIFIKDGLLFNQIYRGDMTNDQMYKRISDTLTMLQTSAE